MLCIGPAMKAAWQDAQSTDTIDSVLRILAQKDIGFTNARQVRVAFAGKAVPDTSKTLPQAGARGHNQMVTITRG